MTIQEIVELKRKTRDEIQNLIDTFFKKTELSSSDIELSIYLDECIKFGKYKSVKVIKPIVNFIVKF